MTYAGFGSLSVLMMDGPVILHTSVLISSGRARSVTSLAQSGQEMDNLRVIPIDQ